MTSRRSTRAKLTAAALAGAFVLAACGGGDDGGSSAAGEAPPAVAVADEVALRPESDIPTNLLPDLVVDNLNDDNKVNLRNFVPSDKPILIWMWAPH